MRRVLFLLLLGVLPAQSGQEPARPANAGISGRWVVNTDFYGSTIYFRMELKQQGEKLSGNFDGDKLEGTLKGNSIYLLAKDEQGGTDEEILEWCFEKGRRLNEGDLFVWNGFASKLGWRDSVTPRLEQRKKEMGIADRNDIQCIPDLIDFDEGRFPEATKST